MAQGCFRGCSGPLGAVHIGLQTPLAMGLYYCTLCRVSKYNHTNFQLFIFKNEDYIAQRYFQGCLGPLGAVQDPQGQFIRGFRPPWPWDFTLIQFAGYLCASIPAFSCLSLYLRILWLISCLGAVQAPQGWFLVGSGQKSLVDFITCLNTYLEECKSIIKRFVAIYSRLTSYIQSLSLTIRGHREPLTM